MDAGAQARRIGMDNNHTIFQETIPSVFRPKKHHKEEKAIKIKRMSADRQLRSSDTHVSRTDMASRWTQTECKTLSEDGERTRQREKECAGSAEQARARPVPTDDCASAAPMFLELTWRLAGLN